MDPLSVVAKDIALVKEKVKTLSNQLQTKDAQIQYLLDQAKQKDSLINLYTDMFSFLFSDFAKSTRGTTKKEDQEVAMVNLQNGTGDRATCFLISEVEALRRALQEEQSKREAIEVQVQRLCEKMMVGSDPSRAQVDAENDNGWRRATLRPTSPSTSLKLSQGLDALYKRGELWAGSTIESGSQVLKKRVCANLFEPL